MMRIKYFWFFILWFCTIIYLSFTPLKGWPQPGIFEKLYLDKVIHLTMYSILCFFLLRGMYKSNGSQSLSSRMTVWGIVFCAGTGIMIEILQPILTAYRSFELPDMIANTAGAMAGFYCYKWVAKRNPFRVKSM